MKNKAIPYLAACTILLTGANVSADLAICGRELVARFQGHLYCPDPEGQNVQPTGAIYTTDDVDALIRKVTKAIDDEGAERKKLEDKLGEQAKVTKAGFRELPQTIAKDPEAARQVLNAFFKQRPELLVEVLVAGLKKKPELARELRATLEAPKK